MRYYFYKGFPFIILGAVVLLAVPYLGLIIFGILALVALAGLAWAIAFLPYTLGRTINRRWQHARSASPPTAPVLSPATNQNPERAALFATFENGHVRCAVAHPVVHISCQGENR